MQIRPATEHTKPLLPARQYRAQHGSVEFQKLLHGNLQRSNPQSEPAAMPVWDQIGLYGTEQLLTNPGGKTLDFADGKRIASSGADMSWGSRIGKDMEDSLLNFKNFFLDATTGTSGYHTEADGTIKKSETSAGLLGSLVNFLKDMGSALSFGMWRPDGEEGPDGISDALLFAASKLKEAIGADLIGGVAGSIVRMGEDLILAGWNLAEAVPDTLIGALDPGKVVIDTIFDNGQVAIDYITDVIPGGEAWMRVHAYDMTRGHFPVFYNLKTPEHFPDDQRWENIRNTPFRKAVETIGSLLADAAMIYTLSQGITASDSRHE